MKTVTTAIVVEGNVSAPLPDPEVALKARRRTFTAAYKLAVLAELDCAKAGETGAILRREGLYSSSLVTWRRQREQGLLQPQAPVRRGPPAARKSDGAQELDRLRRENARLERHLAKAHLIIGIQKKAAQLLAIDLGRSGDES